MCDRSHFRVISLETNHCSGHEVESRGSRCEDHPETGSTKKGPGGARGNDCQDDVWRRMTGVWGTRVPKRYKKLFS